MHGADLTPELDRCCSLGSNKHSHVHVLGHDRTGTQSHHRYLRSVYAISMEARQRNSKRVTTQSNKLLRAMTPMRARSIGQACSADRDLATPRACGPPLTAAPVRRG
eukprot:3819171-Lingulodinium_polyedra.AAC.1